MKTLQFKKLLSILILICYTVLSNAQVTVTGSTGANATYAKLGLAFTAINGTAQAGNNIVITITANTTETATATLNAGTWTSVKIYPTVTGRTISGNLTAPIIDLNGADNVIIDGRLNATGNTKDLTITNTSISANAGTSTIRFINDATYNTVKYCTLKGSSTDASGGIIYISTATTGTSGNDNNIIDSNDITCSTDLNRPLNAISSVGTASKDNNGNTISNNYIYNFLNRGVASNGINIGANTNTESITGNSFFETASFIPGASVAYSIIKINNGSGNSYTISGNYIGGQTFSCGGSAWTKTAAFDNTFYAINLTVGTTTATSVQNNFIKNFSWSNSSSAAWTGIQAASGAINIGTVIGNQIGASTGNGSISITGGATAANVYGIYFSGSGTINCQNNIIGSITTASSNAAYATNIYAIYRANTSTSTINGNIIGSTSTSGSIQASSLSTGNAQSVIGINNTTGGTATINSNTIANLTNATTNATSSTNGLINGIATTSGIVNITNNTINSLTIANANSSSTNLASVCGITTTSTNTINTITGNTISNLSNTYSSFLGSVIGINFGASGANHIVSANFINSISVTGASSTSATIYGIKITSGTTTYSNNIISLVGNSRSIFIGFFENGSAGNNNSIYFNTVYLGGTITVGSLNSFALYSTSSTNTRNFRNNLFFNARTNNGATGKHFGVYFGYTVSTGLTLDYNDYYCPGNGGVLGFYNNVEVNNVPLITGLDANSQKSNPLLANAGGTSATNYKPSYDKLGGTVISTITTDYAFVTRAGTPTLGAYEGSLNLNLSIYKSGVFQASYFRLKEAFDNINLGIYTGALEIRINANTTETASAVLFQSGYTGTGGLSNYSTINIYPTTSGLSVTGNFDAPLIDLNGANNITFDGRVGATGNTKSLIITNSYVGISASTIRFLNSASNNTVKYCTVKGSETSSSNGAIYLSTTSSGAGNDGNVFDNNNITGNSSGRFVNAIYSYGTTGKENSEITVSNNNIYDFLHPGYSSNGVNIGSFSINWSVSGNSFYETSTLIPTGAFTYMPIRITSSNIHLVSGNYIGGSAPLCAGSPLTVNANTSHYFCGIYVTGGTGVSNTCTVQNNIIQNINYTSVEDNPWDGIFINAGDANITGNTIGATTGTGSIVVTTPVGAATCTISGGLVNTISLVGGGSNYTTPPVITFGLNNGGSGATATATLSGGVVTGFTITNQGSGYTSAPPVVFDGQSNGYSTSHGMINAGIGTVNITNNNIGSIRTVGSNTFSHGFESIYLRGATGSNTLTNNLIGSHTTANSIQTSSTAALALQKQDVYGLYSNTAGTTIMTGNTISNITNSYTGTNGATKTRPICVLLGSNTIQNNTIKNISSASAQTGSMATASVIGISIAMPAATSGTTQTVSGNTIYNLSSSNPTAQSIIYGIYYGGPSTGTQNVSGNFIHSISFASTNVNCEMDGIIFNTGLTTCYNNIINLGVGITTGYKINGIWDESGATNNNNIYFNSIYIGGTVSSGVTSATSALWNKNNTSTRNYRNNILTNLRTGGTTGRHYSTYIAITGGTLTIDYNDYYVSASGVLGHYGANDIPTLARWQGIGTSPYGPAQDTHSLATDPVFASAGGTSAINYFPSTSLPGVTGLGITTDYSSVTRASTPKMGALESNNNVWVGTTSNNYATASNWSLNTVPANGSDIAFAATPLNHCVLDQNRSLNNITNGQSTYNLVTNGKQLSISGNLIFTNSAKIDASSTSSTIEFNGSSAQTIPANTFVNNNVYNLTINNSSNVSLNGTLNLLNNLTATSGLLDAFTNSPVLSYSGSTAQTIGSTFVNNKVYDLTINNSGGVTANNNLTVSHLLTINSGKRLTISPAVGINVTGTITNLAGSTGLIIKSSPSQANGSLIFAAGTPSATVEMYSKAFWDLTKSANRKYHWQYFGIPVQTTSAGSTFSNCYIRQYNEPTPQGSTQEDSLKLWTALTANTSMIPTTGYEIVQAAPTTYYFSGLLNNGNYNAMPLTYTSGAFYSGQHIFANPYTAAIDITKLNFDTQTEASVYQYNTGTMKEWEGNSGELITGTSPGQYTVSTKAFAGQNGSPSQIPSMQGFLVKAMSNSVDATFSIPYSSVIPNTSQQRIRQSGENDSTQNKIISTRIDLTGTTLSDKMWIFTDQTCSRKFENGWDGFKMFGSVQAPQLFAMESDGDFQVDAVNDINETYLGFQAGEDKEYKLRFTHQNIELQYESLYLLDLIDNKMVDITADGAEYSFEAETTPTPVKRFKIITQKIETTPSKQAMIKIFESSGTIYIQNLSEKQGEFILYNMAGTAIRKFQFNPNSLTPVPVNVVTGAYILKAKTDAEQVTERMICR